MYSDNRAAANRKWVFARRRWRCPPWPGSKPQPSRIVRSSGFFLPCHYWWKAFLPGELRGFAEFFFDAQKLVVFRDAIGTAGRAGFDLPGARGHHKIGDERIFRFTRPVRHHAGVVRVRAICMASSVSVRVPIWFTLIRIELAMPFSIPLAKISVLVTNMSSPTSWIFLPSVSVSSFQPSQSFSAMPSSIETIGYWPHPLGPELYHLLGSPLALVGFLEDVLLLFAVVELTGGRIKRDANLRARLVSGLGDGFQH